MGSIAAVMAGVGFVTLMGSFWTHLKMTASKRKAKQKVAELEHEAAEQDKDAAGTTDNEENLEERDINWETFNVQRK